MLCRFFPIQDIENALKKVIIGNDKGIDDGCLDVIPYIGLTSPYII
jgi:hypothetical protein